MRSGFVTVVGRPNVGKSSLVQRHGVGTKVSIISSRPNTTRLRVRGVLAPRDGRPGRLRRHAGHPPAEDGSR